MRTLLSLQSLWNKGSSFFSPGHALPIPHTSPRIWNREIGSHFFFSTLMSSGYFSLLLPKRLLCGHPRHSFPILKTLIYIQTGWRPWGHTMISNSVPNLWDKIKARLYPQGFNILLRSKCLWDNLNLLVLNFRSAFLSKPCHHMEKSSFRNL